MYFKNFIVADTEFFIHLIENYKNLGHRMLNEQLDNQHFSLKISITQTFFLSFIFSFYFCHFQRCIELKTSTQAYRTVL